MQRVRITSSRAKPFVRHTTPHFDGTSREVSYSVLFHHTRKLRKSKSLNLPFLQKFTIIFLLLVSEFCGFSLKAVSKHEICGENAENLFKLMKKLKKTRGILLLFVRYSFIIMLTC